MIIIVCLVLILIVWALADYLSKKTIEHPEKRWKYELIFWFVSFVSAGILIIMDMMIN